MSKALKGVLLFGICLLLPGVLRAEGTWIAVVVAADDPVEALSETDIALVFRRKKIYAADGARFQPVNLPADSALRRRFSRAVLKQSPQALEDYWNQQYFQGLLPPHVLASELAVRRFSGQTLHGIGYLSACLVDEKLRTLLLIDPDDRLTPPTADPGCGGMQ